MLKKLRETKVLQGLIAIIPAALLLGYGLYGLIGYYRVTSNDQSVPDPEMVVSSGQFTPDETYINADEDYQVAADLPRQIIISSLDVQGFIQKVAVAEDGTMAVPTNVHMAGWSVQTVKPGERGLSIIDGHLQGKYRPGIFKNLQNLKPGDRFEIEFGDLSRKVFEVVRVGTYSNSDAEERLFQKDPVIERQVTLITCAGQYQEEGYNQRVLVSAKWVE